MHRKVNSKARRKWFLLYTLQNNPTLRVYRKDYLDYVKQIKDRIANHYKTNQTAPFNLMKNINNAFVNDENKEEASSEAEAGLPTVNNWNVLLAVNKFLQTIQSDNQRK